MKIGSKKGFTLIELLIVIAIIGILAVALLPTILGAPAKGRDTARKAQLNAISTAIEAYNLSEGKYPAPTSKCTSALSVIPNFVKYIQGGVVPVDPLSTATVVPKIGSCTLASYGYVLLGTDSAAANAGQNYALSAFMELRANANSNETDLTGWLAGQPLALTAVVDPCPAATTGGTESLCTYTMIK